MTEVRLKFTRKELLYDIQNYAYIEGSIVPENFGHVRHTIQDVGEEGNVDRIGRIMDLVVAKGRDMLYPYTKDAITAGELTNTPEDCDEYVITLQLPDGVSRVSVELLEKMMHEYIVCRAVADWMSITNPQKAEVWLMKATEAEREVKLSINTRMKRIRRTLAPF